MILMVSTFMIYYFWPITTRQFRPHTWGGYVVEAPQGTITNVTGSWVVPSVSCNPRSSSSVLFWVGIDGWNTQNETVEQIGTRSDCVSGVPNYYAWYEFWSRQPNTVPLNNITIKPGDRVTASVLGDPASKSFEMIITDTTTGNSSHARGEYQSAKLTTAEWIAESPVFLNGTRYVIPDFSTMRFYSDFVTTLGQTRALNTLNGAGSVNATRLTYTCLDDTVKAQPSTINRWDDAFSISWRNGGNC
jgi:hypothetical protein